MFQGLQVGAARQAMTRACRLAQIPHYTPARFEAPAAHPLASVGRASSGTRGACRTLQALDEPGRVHARDAGGGGLQRAPHAVLEYRVVGTSSRTNGAPAGALVRQTGGGEREVASRTRRRLGSSRTSLNRGDAMQGLAAAEYFRRTARRTNALLGAVALVALVTVSGAAAGSVTTAAASDVDVSITLLPGAAKPVAGTPFSLNVGMGNAGPDTASARLVVQLPPGLESTLANRLGCPTGTGTLDCGPQQLAAGESTDDILKVVAAKPGTYAIVVHGIDVTPSDSNAANNTASYTAAVSAAAALLTVKMRVFDLDGDILLARVHMGDNRDHQDMGERADLSDLGVLAEGAGLRCHEESAALQSPHTTCSAPRETLLDTRDRLPRERREGAVQRLCEAERAGAPAHLGAREEPLRLSSR